MFHLHPPLQPRRLGTFAWLALAIALVETLVCIKFGKGCVLLKGSFCTAFQHFTICLDAACAGTQPC